MERRRFVVEPSWKEEEQRTDPNSTFKMFVFFPTMPFFPLVYQTVSCP